MPYSNYTLPALRDRLGLTIRKTPLFANAPLSPPSEWLRQTLERTSRLELVSEKARSEFLIAPVLLEAVGFAPDRLTLYSGFPLDAARDLDLFGHCDFALAASPETLLPDAGFLLLAEAKHENLLAALPQVAAQMRAAALMNAATGREPAALFGCVSTGELWQFLRYGDPEILLDPRRYHIGELPALLGVLRAVVEAGLT